MLWLRVIIPPVDNHEHWPDLVRTRGQQATVAPLMAISHRRHGQDETVLYCLDAVSDFQVFSSPQYIYNNKYNSNNTRFVERRGAIASEALEDRSSQLAR